MRAALFALSLSLSLSPNCCLHKQAANAGANFIKKQRPRKSPSDTLCIQLGIKIDKFNGAAKMQ